MEIGADLFSEAIFVKKCFFFQLLIFYIAMIWHLFQLHAIFSALFLHLFE